MEAYSQDLSNRLSPNKAQKKTATIEAEAPTMTVGQRERWKGCVVIKPRTSS